MPTTSSLPASLNSLFCAPPMVSLLPVFTSPRLPPRQTTARGKKLCKRSDIPYLMDQILRLMLQYRGGTGSLVVFVKWLKCGVEHLKSEGKVKVASVELSFRRLTNRRTCQSWTLLGKLRHLHCKAVCRTELTPPKTLDEKRQHGRRRHRSPGGIPHGVLHLQGSLRCAHLRGDAPEREPAPRNLCLWLRIAFGCPIACDCADLQGKRYHCTSPIRHRQDGDV